MFAVLSRVLTVTLIYILILRRTLLWISPRSHKSFSQILLHLLGFVNTTQSYTHDSLIRQPAQLL